MLQTIYHTALFYGTVGIFPYSPGAVAWKLFRNKKGKVRLLNRDLICDTKTLLAMPKSEISLDEFTTAFSPFIPLLTLNAHPWKMRRKILAEGLRKIQVDQDFQIVIPKKKGDVYWDIFEILFKVGFKLIFGRNTNSLDFDQMYPGIVDINRLIKRQTGMADMQSRWKLYHHVVLLFSEENFIFKDSLEFKSLSELDQVSIIVEDLLTSICIQCTDLICHLLLLYPEHRESFKTNLDHCIDETLRLYPLTDIWTRKASETERAWIASLTQLNRSGWQDPNDFKPERWNEKDHPPLISWGFDARSCPATKIGYNLSKAIFQKFIQNENLWIQPAANLKHERTFPLGCQLWISEEKPPKWNFTGKWQALFQQWIFTRLRIINQNELW